MAKEVDEEGRECMDLRRRTRGGSRMGALRRCAVVLVLVLACAGGLAGPVSPQAASAVAASVAAACSTDPTAEGRAGTPVADSLVSVDRADGRIAQFQLFYDATATGGLPFVWQREQGEPAGPFGGWQRVGAATVGPKNHSISAIENSAGRLELLFPSYGSYCHVQEDGSPGGWSVPAPFGLSPAPYQGGVVLFKERDGSIDALASGSRAGRAMELRHQQDAGTGWGPVQSMGQVPEANVGLGQPGTVEQLQDGRLHVTAREWNRDRIWEIVQTAPGGDWGPWQPQSPPSTQPARADASARHVQTSPTASGARLEADRTTSLLDGDIVTFTIAGGPPKAYVWVKQCGPSPSVTTCDDATGRQFRVYPDGTYAPAPKKLYAQLSTGAGGIDCRTVQQGQSCSLALTDNTGALLATLPLHFQPDGSPEAPPTLLVNPHQGLVGGQSVHATGQGYEPRYHVAIMECASGATDTLGCRPRGRPPATSDSGHVDETVTLSVTFTSIDGRTVDCRAEGACELVVFGTRVRGPDSVRQPLEFLATAG
ncbi:neocarzinostatin apoprotein domain-containing protein [Streptomyces sp. HNM0645]|uniref:neocarzinostatin apoprotein domain-containing protein n=1 Tax=Streptomyces sp. HNM0645 TaxID=2782343 RepID=UPI0024B6C6BA|nr:neocarzinostatin apoprotein domain-containing protein [Streptomyces sp. HNM0645]MDI9889187.1 neocarzinostatin apoprotein domain-containing protein [Streptomyces sp. HNM0645]